MMKWKRLGLVYSAPFDGTWRHSAALTPTPLVLKDRVRVFAGFRDTNGISRIGFVDLSPNDPTVILGVSAQPCLEIGSPGMFDDNGVILGDAFISDGRVWMYYVGFQLVEKVKFLAFTGLAVSEDEGSSFRRVQQTPVLDRRPDATFFNAIHSVQNIDNAIHVWTGAGSEFVDIDNKPYPSYRVKHLTTADMLHFSAEEEICIDFAHDGEYRVGRPRVYRNDGGYVMLFTYGDVNGRYGMGAATSANGVEWHRDDEYIGFLPTGNPDDWDGIHLCYGSMFECGGRTYLVYNGNHMGAEGFGMALLST